MSVRHAKTSTAPTPEERATLAQWSGQGGVDHDLNAYYTPTRLAAAMWALAHQHGFTGGRVLEPSIGGGVFAETAPGTAPITFAAAVLRAAGMPQDRLDEFLALAGAELRP